MRNGNFEFVDGTVEELKSMTKRAPDQAVDDINGGALFSKLPLLDKHVIDLALNRKSLDLEQVATFDEFSEEDIKYLSKLCLDVFNAVEKEEKERKATEIASYIKKLYDN